MELAKLSPSQLHILEAGQFINSTITDINSTGINPADDADFLDLYTNLQNQSPTFNTAIGQIQAQAESVLLYNQDKARDRKVTTLRRAWNVHKYTDIQARKDAYEGLKVVMNNYKDIETENYEAESLGLDNFIVQLRNTTHLPMIQVLGLVEHVDNMETANNIFQTTFANRSSTTISTTTYNTAQLRKNIFATYKEMVNYVVVMANRPNRPFFVSILTALNTTRNYYANIIAHRGGGGGTPPAV